MHLSHWNIDANNKFLHLKGIYNKPFTIAMVDDHRIFRMGVKRLIQETFTNCTFVEFTNGDTAYNYINDAYASNNLPHLLITDITHSGLNGLVLIDAIRSLEKIYKPPKRLPIMLITMYDKNDVLQTKPALLGKVEYLYSKTLGGDWLVGCVEECLY